MIELEDGSRLPVSRYRYPEVMARYEAGSGMRNFWSETASEP